MNELSFFVNLFVSIACTFRFYTLILIFYEDFVNKILVCFYQSYLITVEIYIKIWYYIMVKF